MKFRAPLRSIPFLIFCSSFAGCSSFQKPCQEAGDVTWPYASPVKFNRHCDQKLQANGQWINHGSYSEWDGAGHIVLTGQFRMGKKWGRWTQFDPKSNPTGKVVAEKFFENGDEIPDPSKTPPHSANSRER